MSEPEAWEGGRQGGRDRFERAGNAGDADAAFHLGTNFERVAAGLEDAEAERAYARAAEWYARAAAAAQCVRVRVHALMRAGMLAQHARGMWAPRCRRAP